MNILFLDDSEERIKTVKKHYPDAVCVKTASECIDLLSRYSFDVFFADHDLGDEVFVNSDRPDCGMEVIRWIDKNRPEIAQIIVHTNNEPAGIRMVEMLGKAGYGVHRMPFGTFSFKNLIKGD